MTARTYERATHKLTLAQKHELKRLYKDGAKDVDLAEWFGIREATVRYHTKHFRRKYPLRTFDHEKAYRLWKDHGLSKEAIGRRFGVHGTAIGRAIQRIERASA